MDTTEQRGIQRPELELLGQRVLAVRELHRSEVAELGLSGYAPIPVVEFYGGHCLYLASTGVQLRLPSGEIHHVRLQDHGGPR
jgi:hypothetical protein